MPFSTSNAATTKTIFSKDVIVNSHHSDSYGDNVNPIIPESNPNSIVKSPFAKPNNILPLMKAAKNERQQRLHVFRPLFVYRQEQAKKNQQADYHYYYPYYSHYPHYYNQHQNVNGFSDLYESDPFKNYDYISNDISTEKFPTYDFWYE